MYEGEYARTHAHGTPNNLWRLARIMAVFQEATGADFKDTNINILQSQHIIILVSNTGGTEQRTSAPRKTRRGEKKRVEEIESESVGVQV